MLSSHLATPAASSFDFESDNFPPELKDTLVVHRVVTAGNEKALNTVFSEAKETYQTGFRWPNRYQKTYLEGAGTAASSLKQVNKKTNSLITTVLRKTTQHTILPPDVTYADTKNTIGNLVNMYGSQSLITMTLSPGQNFLVPSIYMQKLRLVLQENNKLCIRFHRRFQDMADSTLVGTFLELAHSRVTHLQGLKLDFANSKPFPLPKLKFILQSIQQISRNNPDVKIDLDFSKTGIDDARAKMIAEHLKGVKGVKMLHLGINKMSDEGVEAIAGMLPDTDIEALDIHNNNFSYADGRRGIGNKGMIALFNAN